MKISISILCAFTAVFLFFHIAAFSQKHKEQSLDSLLEANSEEWKVKEHKAFAGIAKPEFGAYTTLEAKKLDSGVMKKKTKDSSFVGLSSDAGWDMSKYITVQKRKFYRMVLGREQDTTQLSFYIHSTSVEKRQTVLGKILSKDDENKDATLDYKKEIGGFILTGTDSIPARFFIEDYVSSRNISYEGPRQNNPTTRGFILINGDSLFTEAVLMTAGKPKSIFFMQWQTGIFMNDKNGVHIALLQFGGDKSYIRIRQDIDIYAQHAIAAFFAVIIGVKDL